MKKNKAKILLISMVITSAYAWETDNFTHRRKILKASSSEIKSNLYNLNDETNKRLRETVEKFNDQIGDCSSDLDRFKEESMMGGKETPKIYKWIKSELGGGLFGAMEEWSEESGEIKQYGDGSNIYGNYYDIQTAFNLNGHVVGPDKLGHFVDQGFDLFTSFVDEGSNKKGFKEAMAYSNDLEEGRYGLFASDVKSYGDMGANFSGMKFWYNLTGKKNSYLTCDEKTGEYKVNRDFNWAEYADDSWDEGVSCSFFDTVANPYEKPGLIKSSSRGRPGRLQPRTFGFEKTNMDKDLEKYLKGLNPPLSCPDGSSQCREIAQMNCSNYFVSPKCIFKANVKATCDMSNFDSLFYVAENSEYKFDREGNPNSSSSNSSNAANK